MKARRRYQKGSISLRSGKWMARWRDDVVDATTGQIRRINRHQVLGSTSDYPTKRLAQRALDERKLTAINAHDYQPTHLSTFAQFVEKWKQTILIHHKPSTQASANAHLRSELLPHFGSFQLKEITTEAVQTYVSTRKGKQPRTVCNYVGVLRMIWNTARSWGYVSHNPFDGIMLPKRQPFQARCFTIPEVNAILLRASEPWRTMFWLAAETGMRGGELCGLRWEDVSETDGIVQVRQSLWEGQVVLPKSKAGLRRFGISPQLSSALLRLRQTRLFPNLPYVFHTRRGTPCERGVVVARHLHPLLDQLKIPHYRTGFHAFRHHSASRMDEANVPVAVRQSRLGHVDALTTIGIYTHVIGDADRQFANHVGTAIQTALDTNTPTVPITTLPSTTEKEPETGPMEQQKRQSPTPRLLPFFVPRVLPSKL